MWADSLDTDFASTANNQFLIRAAGGVGIGTTSPAHLIDVAGGANCDGTTWNDVSDVNAKENFEPVDAAQILELAASLPITTWNYKQDNPEIRHIGPTAQDFRTRFEVGKSDTSLSGVDRSGVALAAIQGLNQKLEGLIEKLEGQNQKLEQENVEMRRRLERLERLLLTKKL